MECIHRRPLTLSLALQVLYNFINSTQKASATAERSLIAQSISFLVEWRIVTAIEYPLHTIPLGSASIPMDFVPECVRWVFVVKKHSILVPRGTHPQPHHMDTLLIHNQRYNECSPLLYILGTQFSCPTNSVHFIHINILIKLIRNFN